MIIRLFMRRVTLATILTIVEFMFIYRFVLDRFLLKIENCRGKKKELILSPFLLIFEIEVVIYKRELQSVFRGSAAANFYFNIILLLYLLCYFNIVKMILSLLETMA